MTQQLSKIFPACYADALRQTAEEHNAKHDGDTLLCILKLASEAAAKGQMSESYEGNLSEAVWAELERRGFMIGAIENPRNETIWSITWAGLHE